MKCGARVALGVAGGYVLGRTKKMKLALMLGGMAMGRRAGGPGAVIGQATKLLGQSPEMSRLNEELRGRLLEAGKGAALAVTARQVESLTDRLTERVGSLADAAVAAGTSPDTKKPDEREEPDTGGPEAEAEAPEPAEAVDDQAEEESGEEAGEEPEEEAPRPRRSRQRAGGGPGGDGAGTATLKRTASAAGAAGRTATKAAPGRKGRPAGTRRGGSDD